MPRWCMILLVIMCSSILQLMDMSDIGRCCWDADGIHFLNTGTTLAVVQSFGLVPCFSESWKNSVNVGVCSSESVLSSLVGMRSGPVALCSLSVDSNLCAPFDMLLLGVASVGVG